MSDKAKEVTVIAEIKVSCPTEAMTIKGFDAAWAYAMSLPIPVEMRFVRWARKDPK